MERAHELLGKQKYYPALLHLLHFADATPVTEDTVSAMHMVGVTLQQIRQYDNAEIYLIRASKAVKNFPSSPLKTDILRDLTAIQARDRRER